MFLTPPDDFVHLANALDTGLPVSEISAFVFPPALPTIFPGWLLRGEKNVC